MKELKCHKCGCYLGDIEKGKIKNGAVLLCRGCFKLMNDLLNYKKSIGGQANDIMDSFKDIFKGTGYSR